MIHYNRVCVSLHKILLETASENPWREKERRNRFVSREAKERRGPAMATPHMMCKKREGLYIEIRQRQADEIEKTKTEGRE